MGQEPEINFQESYVDIPENNMVSALTDDLPKTRKQMTSVGLIQNFTRQGKLTVHLKTELRNCLTPAFGDALEESMPEGISNKDGCIYFIVIIACTFPDKEAHKHIIRDYTSWN
jgi:hypothetical protein